MKIETLWKVNVGSHMWKMKNAASDFDVSEVYAVPSEIILKGMSYPITKAQSKFLRADGVEVDLCSQEIGHLVNKLIGGNINAIWTVMSPIILQDSPVLQELRKIVKDTVAKNCFQSINGMATSQLRDAVRHVSGVHAPAGAYSPESKKLMTAFRTIQFGINLLKTGKFEFKPVLYDISEGEVRAAFDELNEAYENSKLPEAPDENAFRNFLFVFRMKNMFDETEGKRL